MGKLLFLLLLSEEVLRLLLYTIGMWLLYLIVWALVLWPWLLRSLLKMQGIDGPAPDIFLGNFEEMCKAKASRQHQTPQEMTHDCSSKLFPIFDRWKEEYGWYILTIHIMISSLLQICELRLY